MDRLDFSAAAALARHAIAGLGEDAALFAVTVTIEREQLYLNLQDIESGWRVVLAFYPDQEPAGVRERVRHAVRLRRWRTAPPAVILASGCPGEGVGHERQTA